MPISKEVVWVYLEVTLQTLRILYPRIPCKCRVALTAHCELKQRQECRNQVREFRAYY